VDGIDITAFENRFGADFEILFAPLLTEYSSTKYFEIAPNRCRLTRRGMLFADSIASRFINLI
jgi:coproporphyrinogen III oxidase-like Fe-S oxidoreductase